MSTSATPQNLVFVLDDIADWQTLIADIPEDAQVHLLDTQGDALAQLVAILTGQYDAGSVDAIHILSHGSSGAVRLGSLTLDNTTLGDHAEALGALGSALSENGDILLYGCDVANGATGVNFLGRLAQMTGADVAASTDLTGAASLGGDWVLEAATGAIDTSALEIEAMQSVLGADSQLPSGLASAPYEWNGITFQTRYNGEITDSDPENPLKPGNKWDRYVLSGVANGTVVKVYMGNSSTVDDYIQIGRNGSIVTQNDDGGDGERSYDAYVSWTYQAGDVIHATTFSSGYRGTYT